MKLTAEPELIVGTDAFRGMLTALREAWRRNAIDAESANLLAQMEKAQRVAVLEAKKTIALEWSESDEGSKRRIQEARTLLGKIPHMVIVQEISIEQEKTTSYTAAIDALLARS